MKPFTTFLRATACAALMAASCAMAQDFPSKPLRILVPYPAGGAVDAVARIVGEKLGEKWGTPVIVENRGGANGLIGTGAILQAPADGYTVGLIAVAHTVNPAIVRKMPFQLSDFTAVTILVQTQMGVLVNPALGVNSIAELIALLKKSPGKLNLGVGARGSVNELWAVAFEQATGTRMTPVPYRGSGAIYPDLIAGHVDIDFDGIAGPAGQIKAGQLKLLAVGGAKRAVDFPDVPTMVEAGVPGYVYGSWVGAIVRRGTPQAVIDKISRDMAAVMAEPDTRSRLGKLNAEIVSSTPAQAEKTIDDEAARMAKLVKAAGIELE
jgi:tripartite-type tricarboxylate transporter receptor subunit TctC